MDEKTKQSLALIVDSYTSMKFDDRGWYTQTPPAPIPHGSRHVEFFEAWKALRRYLGRPVDTAPEGVGTPRVGAALLTPPKEAA